MSFNDIPETGKVLLAIGGGLLVGTIIAELLDDGSTRETRLSTKRKSKTRQNLSSTRTKKYVIEVGQPDHDYRIPSETTSNSNRKYPDHYYSLTKQQQYKYRQRMAKELFERSQNA